MAIFPPGAEVWRDNNVDGVPASGSHQPAKSDIRAWAAAIETTLGFGSQRSVQTNNDLPIKATDVIVLLDSAADLAPVVPSAAALGGRAITFLNVGAHVQTLMPTGTDKFSNQATWPLAPWQGVTFRAINDGVHNALGYFVS
jgi:hypothetical protein